MSRLLVKGGRVIDPAVGLDGARDVLLDGGRILAVEESIDADGVEVFDATGKIVAPGFIDLRARLREPGLEHAETIETGTKAAAAGGFTAVCAMPHTSPCNDSPTVTRFIRGRAAENGKVRVLPVGALTHGCKGEQLAEIGSMKEAGVAAVCDGDRSLRDSGLMRRAMRYAQSFNLTVIAHCEDPYLGAGGQIADGPKASRLGLTGIPSSAETVIVAREIVLAAETGARTHLTHLSTRESVEMVRRARADGIPVTADVSAHHLALTVDDVPDYDSNFKLRPPLRTAEDREALIEGLADGSLAAVISDHAPHTGNVKMQEFEDCPFGASGLETAVSLTMQALGERVPLPRLIEFFTTGPAQALGRKSLGRLAIDGPADLTVLDLERQWTFRVEDSASKSRNSPVNGRTFSGGPAATIVAGNVVWQAGA